MPPRLDCIIFCDDIRLESGNKVTLVGIYGSTLFIPADAKFPAALRQFCVFLRWRGIKGGEKIYFDVSYNGDELIKPGNPLELKASRDDQEEYSQTSLFLSAMIFKGFGEYKFRIFLQHHPEPFGEAVLRVLPQPQAVPV